MQVVQRLVTLRDKLSGADDGVDTGDCAAGVMATALTNPPYIGATSSYVDRPRASSRGASEDILIAPGFRLIFTFFVGGCDIAAAAFAAVLLAPVGELAPAFFTSAALLVLAAQLCGLYQIDSATATRRTARSVLALGVIFVPLVAGIVWLMAGASVALDVAVGLLGAAATMLGARAVAALAIQRLADRLAERVLIVGQCDATEQFLRAPGQVPARTRVVGQIAVGEGQPCLPLIGRIWTDHEPTAPTTYPTRGVDRVLILRAGLDDLQLAAIVRQLEALSLPVHVLMELPGAQSAQGLLDRAGWVVQERSITHASLVAKRAVDLVVSGLALLFLGPLMLCIAILVRLDSAGPALFRQTRLGRDNQPFTVFKYRTMRVDAHATDGSVQATRGDSRVTRIGGLLRKTSIDELPQLFNVLNGSMSLVGPRPHPTELNKKFMPLIESYSARHRIAPGITGWAQVNGLRGETRTVEQMQRRVELDLEYIRDRSVAFDLWILLRTVVSVFAHRNAAY